MVMRRGHFVRLLTLSAVVIGCGDQPPPVDPPLAQPTTTSKPAASVPPAGSVRIAGTEATGLSAGMRAAMTQTLAAALSEYDLEPIAPFGDLEEFFRDIDANQAGGPDRAIVHP